VNAKWVEFFNKGDFAGVASLYTEDATAFPPGSGMVKGKAAIGAMWKNMAEKVADPQLTTLDVKPLGPYSIEEGMLSNMTMGLIDYDEATSKSTALCWMFVCTTNRTSGAELGGRSSQSSTRVASHEFDRPAVAGRSILTSARERERWSGFELILRHVEDPMVRIGARAFRASVRKRAALAHGGPASGSGRRWGRAGTGRCYGPVHPADLAIGNRHVVLAQAKEPTHPDHNGFELSVPINDELGDVADPLACVIVNIESD
jgi:SnoaL-like domain